MAGLSWGDEEDLGEEEDRGEEIERRDEELQELAPEEPRPSWISFLTFDFMLNQVWGELAYESLLW